MNKIIRVVIFPLTMVALIMIVFYKLALSPFLKKTCNFQPTCSTYALIAIKRFGIFSGSILALKRICRCVPNAKGGLDAVPDNIKGEIRWLL